MGKFSIATVDGVECPVIEINGDESLHKMLCSFCGVELYSPLRKALMAGMREHIKKCDAHPLAEARRRIAELEDELAEMRALAKAKQHKPNAKHPKE